eukprot:4180158-Prymnesium_polylepis.1
MITIKPEIPFLERGWRILVSALRGRPSWLSALRVRPSSALRSRARERGSEVVETAAPTRPPHLPRRQYSAGLSRQVSGCYRTHDCHTPCSVHTTDCAHCPDLWQAFAD